MVDGCEKKVRECAVVDLDNTLLDGNSTKMLAVFLSKKLVREGDYADAFRIINAIMRRKFRLTTHSEMKKKIVGMAMRKFDVSDIREFVDWLVDRLNDEVCMELEKYEQVLIATAAADFFMPEFVSRLGFDADFVATSYSEEYVENRGEVKLESVKRYLDENGCRMSVFFTDHIDDLPLLRYNTGRNVLVNSSIKI